MIRTTTAGHNDDLNYLTAIVLLHPRVTDSEHYWSAYGGLEQYPKVVNWSDTDGVATQWNCIFELFTCYLWHLWICTSPNLPIFSRISICTFPSPFCCFFCVLLHLLTHLKPTKRSFVSSNLTIIFFRCPPSGTKDHFPRNRRYVFALAALTSVGKFSFIFIFNQTIGNSLIGTNSK